MSTQRHDELTAEQARAVVRRDVHIQQTGWRGMPLTRDTSLITYGRGPYTLATTAPVDADTAERISDALGGACWFEGVVPWVSIRMRDGSLMRRDTGGEHAGEWRRYVADSGGSGCFAGLGSQWRGWLRLSDSDAREETQGERQCVAVEPVTFGPEAAQAALEAGGSIIHTGCVDGVYRLAPGYTPTAAVVSAIVKAEPERLCASRGSFLVGLVDGFWRHWSGSGWVGNVLPPGGQALAIRPDYEPEGASEAVPQNPWIDDQCDDPGFAQALLAEAAKMDFPPDYSTEQTITNPAEIWRVVQRGCLTPGEVCGYDAEGDGVRVSVASNRAHINGGVSYCVAFPVTLFAIPKAPEVEPRSGVELRRWMVANPGRGVRVDGDRLAAWWDADLCDFYTADGPASIDDHMSGVPADGTWDKPGEGEGE